MGLHDFIPLLNFSNCRSSCTRNRVSQVSRHSTDNKFLEDHRVGVHKLRVRGYHLIVELLERAVLGAVAPDVDWGLALLLPKVENCLSLLQWHAFVHEHLLRREKISLEFDSQSILKDLKRGIQSSSSGCGGDSNFLSVFEHAFEEEIRVAHQIRPQDIVEICGLELVEHLCDSFIYLLAPSINALQAGRDFMHQRIILFNNVLDLYAVVDHSWQLKSCGNARIEKVSLLLGVIGQKILLTYISYPQVLRIIEMSLISWLPVIRSIGHSSFDWEGLRC